MIGAAAFMTLWAGGAAAQRSILAVLSKGRADASQGSQPQDDRGAESCVAHPRAAPPSATASYAQIIQQRIHQNCRQRPDCPRDGGAAIVTFTISGQGALVAATVSQSSGNRELDNIAIESVRGAGLFPPTPTGGEMKFSAPFQFR